MLSVNELYFAGNAGRDAEVKTTQNGKRIGSFSLCHTSKSGDKEYTTWVKVNAFQPWLVDACESIKKGDNIFVQGMLTVRAYTDKNGVERISVEILASRIAKIERKPKAPRAADPGDEMPTVDSSLDDIPF